MILSLLASTLLATYHITTAFSIPLDSPQTLTSPSLLHKRASGYHTSCDQYQVSVIEQAIQGVKNYANAAANAVPADGNTPLYKKYFNDQSMATVKKVYTSLASFSMSTDPGFIFYCNTDPKGSTDCAKSGGNAYSDGDAGGYITLCDYYFSNVWSSAICHQPGDTVSQAEIPGNYFKSKPGDQVSILLHEMTHMSSVVGGVTGIGDGPDGHTYRYSDVVALATNAATNGDKPITCAQTFQFFAQAASSGVSNPSPPCQSCTFKPAGGCSSTLFGKKSPACNKPCA